MSLFFEKLHSKELSQDVILVQLKTFLKETDFIELSTKKEISKITTFLCQINHFEALKYILVSCLKRPDKIPGDALFYYLTKSTSINITESVFQKMNEEEDFFKIYLCPFTLNKFIYSDLILDQYEAYLKKYLKNKEELIDKLQFARTQRLESEVKKTLEKLLEAFPNDPVFIEEKGKYYEKEAALVIDRRSKKRVSKQLQISNFQPQQSLYNSEELYESIHTYFNSKNSENLLYIFILAGEYHMVINIFENYLELKKKYFWTYVETLIYLSRHLDALSALQNLNPNLNPKGDDQFNYHYLTAICLWYLNNKENAIEIMKSIVKVRPSFKQAVMYLNMWQRSDDVA